MKNKYESLKGTLKKRKEHIIKPTSEAVTPINKEKVKETKEMEVKAICQYCIAYIKPTCNKHNKFTMRKATCGDFIQK